ncbi:MAG: hypothetical protein RLZZ628_4315 [Bacteroidota bacterium]|jgi:opacity protein-like surface antigen
MRKIISALLVIGTTFALNAQNTDFAAVTSNHSAFEAKKKRRSSSGDAFAQGKFTLNLGYGLTTLGTNYFASYESFGNYSVSSLGPIFVKAGYGITDKIEAGLNFNYNQASATFSTPSFLGLNNNYTATYQYSSWSAIARVTGHFLTSEKLDPYWTAGVGYRSLAFKFTSNDPIFPTLTPTISAPFAFEAGAGLRYYFTPNIGVYVEAGLSSSPLQAGLAVQF